MKIMKNTVFKDKPGESARVCQFALWVNTLKDGSYPELL